jgi:hypothetical protein
MDITQYTKANLKVGVEWNYYKDSIAKQHTSTPQIMVKWLW